MGLLKRRTLPNGVAVKYHRIVQITHVVNQESSVLVHSYLSQARRNELEEDEHADVFVSEAWFKAECDTTMDVEAAYGWLKGQEEFAGAEDVFEEGQGGGSDGTE